MLFVLPTEQRYEDSRPYPRPAFHDAVNSRHLAGDGTLSDEWRRGGDNGVRRQSSSSSSASGHHLQQQQQHHASPHHSPYTTSPYGSLLTPPVQPAAMPPFCGEIR